MIHEHQLIFKTPSGTSRGVLTEKPTWIITSEKQNRKVYGEISIIKSLNTEWNADYPKIIEEYTRGKTINQDAERFTNQPSLRMGLEMIEHGQKFESPFQYFDNSFADGKMSIPINGLIWMDKKEKMRAQIEDKIARGFTCVKLKIGAIEWDQELELLKFIRNKWGDAIELRVDANGAFYPDKVLKVLEQLAALNIHSIEQPITQNQEKKMSDLCSKTPLPIALDEELIGKNTVDEKQQLLEQIQPQYIILKPSLLGGFTSCDEWIKIAESLNTGWWLTSALESNIGLNAIAQYAASKKTTMPQGLGTGQLYTNNFASPLEISNGAIAYNTNKDWKMPY